MTEQKNIQELKTTQGTITAQGTRTAQKIRTVQKVKSTEKTKSVIELEEHNKKPYNELCNKMREQKCCCCKNTQEKFRLGKLEKFM